MLSPVYQFGLITTAQCLNRGRYHISNKHIINSYYFSDKQPQLNVESVMKNDRGS